jgi:aminoglycoside phosphotransferase (APT) family kinase protein
VKLPEHIPVPVAVLRELAHRYHAPHAGTFDALPENGIFNAHYALGPNSVLRVPRNHPEHFAAVRREAIAIPTARNAGVHTPELVAIDNSCELLPCPFGVYVRVHGQTLESLDLSPHAAREIWRELGRQLARLHAVAPNAENRSIPPPGPCRIRASWLMRMPRPAGSPHGRRAGCRRSWLDSHRWRSSRRASGSCMGIPKAAM